jgi:predicted PurR-regulated permease PerM
MISSFMINFCGVFVSGFGTVFFNLIGAAYYKQNPSLNYLNLVMLILGSFCALFGFIFILVIQCTLSVWYKSNQLINQPNELNRADDYQLANFSNSNLQQTNNNQAEQPYNCENEQQSPQDCADSSYVLNEQDQAQSLTKLKVESPQLLPPLPSYKDLASKNQNQNLNKNQNGNNMT